jgi:hypothetical protein
VRVAARNFIAELNRLLDANPEQRALLLEEARVKRGTL